VGNVYITLQLIYSVNGAPNFIRIVLVLWEILQKNILVSFFWTQCKYNTLYTCDNNSTPNISASDDMHDNQSVTVHQYETKVVAKRNNYEHNQY